MVLSLAANNLSNSRESPLFIKHTRQHLLSAFDKNILLLLFQKANSKCHDEDLVLSSSDNLPLVLPIYMAFCCNVKLKTS
jgi:hypothetical protein